MGDYPGIYRGTDYGFDPKYEPAAPLIPSKYRIQPGQFGITTDPRSANQLKEVSDKLNTGAKTIELSGISTEVLESVPDQHLREIARLKKLAGADITFHGPLVEPTGFNQQGNWEEASRIQAEKQIWDAVKRGQQMMLKDVRKAEQGETPEYENGNLVVTLHTNNGLPSVKKVMKEKDENGNMVENLKGFQVIDEYSGKSGYLPVEIDEFESNESDKEKRKKMTITEIQDLELDKINRKVWNSNLHNISIEASKGKERIDLGLRILSKDDEVQTKEIDELRHLYKLYKEDRQTYENVVNNKSTPMLQLFGEQIDNKIDYLAQGETFVRDSYDQMKDMYNRAKEALERELKKDPGNSDAREAYEQIMEFKNDASEDLKKWKEDPLKIKEFADTVSKGLRVLSTLKHYPQQYRPMEEFAVEQAAETFSGVAAKAYNAFGDKAPILSIENPPADTSGLTRADEIKRLIEESRKRLSQKLQKDQELTKREADAAAEKLIGVTWDVGHINMIKKYGYDDSDLKKQTKTIKPYLKHVHLSDNFGLEHTELPMGMGNVPMKEHLEVIGGDMKKMKAIIETGGHWYQDFKVSPLAESFAAFGSPIYPMQMQPYWDKTQAQMGSYFSGYGMNPDVHHSIYGAGFSGLPVELGGQVQGRNRLSGNPLE